MTQTKTPEGLLVATNPAACASERRQPCPRVESEEAVRVDKAVRAPAAMNNLPLDWEEIQISDVTVRTKQRDPRRQPTMRFRYVDVSSVSNSSFRIVEATEIEGSAAPSRARKEICAGDVLFATVRPTLKRVALVPPELHGQIASTGFIVLRADPEKLNPRYLYSRLLTDAFIKRMGELERGASYPAVRDTDVLNEVVPVPPLAEQRKIAGVLGVVQRAMEQQERLIVLTTELKKALLHKLFTEGLRGEPQKQTDIGPVPESWEVRRFGEVATLKNGINFTSAQKGDNGILTVDVLNMYGDGVTVGLDKVYRVNKPINEDYHLKDGDLLFVRSSVKLAGVGWTCMFRSINEPATFCGFIIRARLLDPNVSRPKFLTHYFRTDQARRTLIAGGAKVSITNINQGLLQDILCPMPSIKEQDEIADAVDQIDRKIALHKAKKAKLEDLFRTLLHQLMTAQLRVHALDLSEMPEDA